MVFLVFFDYSYIYKKTPEKMAQTKRMLEEIYESDFYPCDLDYQYQLWYAEKHKHDQEGYINYVLDKLSPPQKGWKTNDWKDGKR
jgi:hypothetical protein